MRVTSINPLLAMQKIQAGEAPATRRKGDGKSDRVSFSNEAQRLREQARSEHVTKIAEAIADGSYRVDIDRLAEAFISRETR